MNSLNYYREFTLKDLENSFYFLNRLPIMIWATDTKLNCIYVNDEWVKFTGLSFEEAFNNGQSDFIMFDDFDNRQLRKEIVNKKSFQVKTRLRKCNGEFRWCLIDGVPYYDGQNNFQGYLGSIFDIDEQLQEKDNLNRYQKLAQNTENIILFIGLDGSIIEANSAAVKAYGYTYDELCSLNIRNIRADWGYTQQQMKIADEEGIVFEALHRRKDGSCFNVEVSSRGTTMGGERILSSIIRDITKRKQAEQLLKNQEELFRTIFEQSPVGIVFGDKYNSMKKFNIAFEKLTGRTKEDLLNLSWIDITHPEDVKKDLDLYKDLLAGKNDGYSITKRYIKPDNSIVWVQLSLTPLKVAGNNDDISHICMIEDITEQIKAEEELRESERSKSVLLSNLPGMAYRCNYDKNWTMKFISDGCYELTGYMSDELLNNKLLSYNDIIHPDFREHLWKKWSEMLPKNDIVKEEYSIITASGEEKWVYEQGRGIYDDKGNVIALEGLIIDISDRKKREDEIRYLNYHDSITGLYNRRFFDEKKKDLDIKSNFPLSVIIGDINGLKLINDTLGHEQGDKQIVAIAEILKSACRKRDVLARTGGDEFSILLPSTTNEEAFGIIKKIEDACYKYKSNFSNEIYHLSISLGCATKTNMNEKISLIIKDAEDKMYRSKLLENKSLHSSLISSMKTTLYERSQETEEHAQRLIKQSKSIGKKMNLSDEQLNELELLATLHDIGKIGIQDNILNKPGSLSALEWVQMKKHTEIGYRIAMSSYDLKHVANYILHHHEHFDGSGYPKGLKGKEIPLLSRIIAIVDAFDAITNERPYKKKESIKFALNELRKNAGTQFDPEIVELFIKEITDN